MTENMTMRCYINYQQYIRYCLDTERKHFKMKWKQKETKSIYRKKTYFRFEKLNWRSYVVRCVSNKIKYKCFETRETIFSEILFRSIFKIIKISFRLRLATLKIKNLFSMIITQHYNLNIDAFNLLWIGILFSVRFVKSPSSDIGSSNPQY